MESVISQRPLPYRTDGKWGYLDPSGALLQEACFDYAGRFRENFAYIENDGRMHILDNELRVTGTVDGVSSYDRFSEGLLQVQRLKDEKYVFIDTAGRQAFDVKCDNAFSFSSGRAFVEVDGLWGMLDLLGHWIVPPQYEWAVPFAPGARTTSVRRRGNDHAELIDQGGEVVLSPQVELLRHVSEGLVPFGKVMDGTMRFGVMDEQGNQVVSPQFAECDNGFRSGLLGVEVDDGRWGVIDRLGRWILQPTYTYVGECSDALLLAYRGGSRTSDRSLVGGKFGYVIAAGDARIAFEFDEAFPFDAGIAAVAWYGNSRSDDITILMGYVTSDGRVIWREEASK